MEDSLANWQWLVSLPRREEAVVLGPPNAASSSHLADGFTRARTFDPTGWIADLERFRGEWSATYPRGSVDCIAALDVDSLVGTDRSDHHAIAILETLRDALRPRVGVYAGLESLGAERRFARRVTSRHERQLHAAGFRGIRAYYVVRSPAEPRHFVPASRKSLLAWDRAIDPPSVRAMVRRTCLFLGLHTPFFQYRLLVATS